MYFFCPSPSVTLSPPSFVYSAASLSVPPSVCYCQAVYRVHRSGVVYKFSLLLVIQTFKSETSLSCFALSYSSVSLQVSSLHLIWCIKGRFSTQSLKI
jgi:hypothetical protein